MNTDSSGNSNHGTTDDSTKDQEWRPVPTAYNLNTIGIHGFLAPPSQHLGNDCNQTDPTSVPTSASASAPTPSVKDATASTWEIWGNIKSKPDDFIVREIGGVNVNINSNVNASAKIDLDRGNKKDRENVTKKDNQNILDSLSGARIANLTDALTLPSGDGSGDHHDGGQSKIEPAAKKMKMSAETNKGTIVDPDPDAHTSSGSQHPSQASSKKEDEPAPPVIQYEASLEAVIQELINQCKLPDTTARIYEQLKDLSDDAMMGLKTKGVQIRRLIRKQKSGVDNVDQYNGRISIEEESGHTPVCKRICIPPFTDDILIQEKGDEISSFPSAPGRGGSDNNGGKSKRETFRNRATFHRKMKISFPLLKSFTMSEEDSDAEWKKRTWNLEVKDGSIKDDSSYTRTGRFVVVEPDTAFHDLIPYLLDPYRDLPMLYQFRNRGCTGASPRQNRKKKRKGKGDHSSPDNKDSGSKGDENANTCAQVLLYLKPEMERTKRKEIHHLISTMYRDFETGTKNDLIWKDMEFASGSETDSKQGDLRTTAITVQWSKKAQNTWLKRKRKDARRAAEATSSGQGQRGIDDFAHTLCVLKKRKQEHLSAVNHLAAALRCPQSDIGLAGIKDMQAVTYQFCTLRNMSPFRVRSANAYLKNKNIELGNFERVDWLLNQGHLYGNSFEIVLRDLKRVEVRAAAAQDGFEERFVPCDRSHIEQMVDRIHQHGFINFYGEQRMGEAGPKDEVGVRPGDIGKAMLKGDFTEAIRLLMKGRGKRRGGDLIENEKIRHMRETFDKTDGDPVATLAVFPRTDALGRERTVLQGLKRYGRDKPLEAIRCLHFNVRMFWINAYQSLVWNAMASERIKLLGCTAVEGDLYKDENNGEVKIAKKDDVINIKQVVLPLPGSNIRYPENIIGKLYQNFLKEDGVEFRKGHTLESSAKGGYRNLVSTAKDLMWEPIDDEVVFCGDRRNTVKNDEITNARFKFVLQSGSYATMFLRELMVTTSGRESHCE